MTTKLEIALSLLALLLTVLLVYYAIEYQNAIINYNYLWNETLKFNETHYCYEYNPFEKYECYPKGKVVCYERVPI